MSENIQKNVVSLAVSTSDLHISPSANSANFMASRSNDSGNSEPLSCQSRESLLNSFEICSYYSQVI